MIQAILYFVIGYLVGSVPWALVIGKVFYHKDIREYGSHNAGATNAGRVLGKPIFYIVVILDASKGFITYMILQQFNVDLAMIGAIGVIIGHSYPIYFNFKGGKGVATSAGVLLAISLTGVNDFLIQFCIPVACFVVVLLLTSYVSLSSITAYTVATIICWLYNDSLVIKVCLTILCIFVILKHHENINRLIKGTENKSNLLKKSK